MRTINFSILLILFWVSSFGQSWKPVGFGLSGGTSASCMFIDSTNNLLYIGGDFTNSNGFPLNKIAKWDGVNWTTVNTIAAPISVGEIAVLNNVVFIANYTNNKVWKWDGISWSALPAFDDGINCLTIINDTLYAGGPFTWASNRYVRGIAKWNGSNWDSLSSGLSGCQCASFVNSIVKYQNKIVVGGLFWTAGNDTAYNLAEWDGLNWSPIGGGVVGLDMYNTYIFDLFSDDTDLFVGGSFQNAGGLTVNGIARWDGISWHNIGVPNYLGANLILKYNNEVFAYGGFLYGLGKWDGTNWQSYHSLELNGEIKKMVVYNNELYVSGNFVNDTNSLSLKHIARSKILHLENENLYCFTDCDGVATATNIGIPPNTYLWSNGDVTQNINNLCTGNYTVTVTDSTGSSSFGTVTITSPPEIIISDTSVNASCPTCIDGMTTATVAGGIIPYVYQWSNGATTRSIDNLLPGIYIVTVTDNNGCVIFDSVTVGFDVGVEQLITDFGQLIIYPNPVTSIATIQFQTINSGKSTVTVENCLGQVVLTQNLTIKNQKGTATIDMSSYASGMYFIKCFDGKQQTVIKIVKN